MLIAKSPLPRLATPLANDLLSSGALSKELLAREPKPLRRLYRSDPVR